LSGEEEPSRGTIVREILVFTILCLVVGGIFVAYRVQRLGTQVLTPQGRVR
jgi:hypothetical protein